MDRVVPSSFPTNAISADDKYRKNLADKYKNLPGKGKKQPDNEGHKENWTDDEILALVREVNAYFASFGQNLLVLIRKKPKETVLEIINCQTHETIREIPPNELLDVARNLRNHKLSLIERDV